MKVTAEGLKEIVRGLISEAKKKKTKAKKLKKEVKPTGYSFDEAFDFSAPLGGYNLYASQGASNWGPMTGPGTKLDDNASRARVEEGAVRALARQVISESVNPRDSAWAPLMEQSAPKNIWEAAQHWYDNQKRGLGSGKMSEKKAPKPPKAKGFKKPSFGGSK